MFVQSNAANHLDDPNGPNESNKENPVTIFVNVSV